MEIAVTGASRGIGRATTLELARQGHHIFALARSGADLDALAAQARREGGNVTPIVMDIADDSSREAAVAAIMRATDGYGLDALVNNAGYGQNGPLEEVPIAKLRRQFEVNVIGLFAFTQPFLPGMRERRHGWIVNISSAAGRIATPFTGAYNGSKFALEGMSDALRLELAPFGIHVVLIEPGPITSSFGAAAAETAEERGDSAYARFFRRYKGARTGANLFSRSSEAVARLIARVIRSEHPRARYTIALPAKLATIGRRLVPDVLMDWIYRVIMGLS